jgi:hypothetical protein
MKKLLILCVLACASSLHAETSWATASTDQIGTSEKVASANLNAAQLAALHRRFVTLVTKQCKSYPAYTRDESAFQSWRIRPVSLDGNSSEFLVQPTGSCLCGVAGNCPFYVLDANMKDLLLYNAQTFAVLPQSTNGYRDLVLSLHGSAAESYVMLYQFTGQFYRRIQCAGVSSTSGQPRITIEKCR